MKTETETKTIAEFIAANRISMTAERVDANPNMEPTVAGNMDHWKVRFVRRAHDSLRIRQTSQRIEARLTTYFSMGYGHHGKEPEAPQVLDCLASDASGADQHSFEDWCAEYGYDTDSRKAEKTFKACERSAERLKQFLGDTAYAELLYGTERE